MVLSEELALHIPVLKRFAQRALGHVAEVEDLVQETLVAAVTHEREFHGRSSVKTWLLGILSHKVTDYLRHCSHPSRQGQPSREDDLEELTAPPSLSPEHALDQKRAVAIIERMLPTLPEQERLAVLMVDVQEMDRDWVCNTLKVTATHLRVLLHRGRHHLRRALEDVHLSNRS